jgi:hypothetical protein
MTIFVGVHGQDSWLAETGEPEATFGVTASNPLPKMRSSAGRSKPPDAGRERWEAQDFGPILRVQYYESLANSRVPSGEIKLLFGVLEDALRCFVQARKRHSSASLKAFLEAKDWFYNRQDSNVFSFESVCAVLDLDPDAVRSRLRSLEPADFPLQHFCNRRRLCGGSRTTRNRSALNSGVVFTRLADRIPPAQPAETTFPRVC